MQMNVVHYKIRGLNSNVMKRAETVRPLFASQARTSVNFLDVLSLMPFTSPAAVAMATEKFSFIRTAAPPLCQMSVPVMKAASKKQINKGDIISHLLLCVDVLLCVCASKLCGPLCLTAVHHNSNSRGIGWVRSGQRDH